MNLSKLRNKLINLIKSPSLDDRDYQGLHALKNIMTAREPDMSASNGVEAYTMLDHSDEQELLSRQKDKTFIVKRMHITFND